MSLKELLRIVWRRRLSAAVISTVVFFLFLFTLKTQPPFYSSETRVLITTPEPINLASSMLPEPQWISENLLLTWIDLIGSRGVRELVPKYLEGLPAELHQRVMEEDWISRVKVSRVEQTEMLLITVDGPDPSSSVFLTNAFARAAAEYSTLFANKKFHRIRNQANEELQRRRDRLAASEEAKNLLIQGYGGIDVALENDRLYSNYKEVQGLIFQLRRKKEENENRVRQVKEELARLAALTSGPLPRRDPEAEIGARRDPNVQSLEQQIRSLKQEILVLRTKYTPIHPTLIAMEARLRQLESSLGQLIPEALRLLLTQEEQELQREIKLANAELLSLPRRRTEIQDDILKLTPPLRQYQRLDLEIAKEREVITNIETLLGRFDLVKELTGYVMLIDDQMAQSAREVVPQGQQVLWMSILVALLAGVGFCFLMEQLDTKIRTDYDVRRHLNIPLLAAVPRVPPEDVMLHTAARESFLAESFDTLATTLPKIAGNRPLHTLVVVSTNPGEGKTTVSVNTAVALARQGRRVLLIDADMRVPMVHSMLRLPNQIGFSNLLGGGLTAEENRRLLHQSTVENLQVICSGPTPENPYALLDPQRCLPILEDLQRNYDIIIIDTPPILRTGDAIKLASLADGVLLVVGAYETDQRQAAWAKRLLENVSAKLLGVLLNKSTEAGEQYYYYYSSPYGGYGKGYRRTTKKA